MVALDGKGGKGNLEIQMPLQIGRDATPIYFLVPRFAGFGWRRACAKSDTATERPEADLECIKRAAFEASFPDVVIKISFGRTIMFL
jgi:hypothetical protein